MPYAVWLVFTTPTFTLAWGLSSVDLNLTQEVFLLVL